MNVLRAILVRDFRRTIRSPLTTVLLLCLPLGMGTLISLAFGSGPPQVRLFVSFQDESALGEMIDGDRGHRRRGGRPRRELHHRGSELDPGSAGADPAER